MIYTYLFIAVLVLSILVHLNFEKRPVKRGRLIEIVLVNTVFWGVGIKGLWGFLVNSCGFLDSWLADLLEWPVGGSWQILLGISMLAFGVAGILAATLKGGFLVATVFGTVIYSVGATFALFFNGASWPMLTYAIVYYCVGSAFLLGVWLYYWRLVGTTVAWRCCGTLGGEKK